MEDTLHTYLHDHHAGALVAEELLGSLRKHQHPLAEFAEQMLTEVVSDRHSLEAIADRLGLRADSFKDTAGRLGEKALELKFRSSIEPFAVFETLEFLALGVLGKLKLWLALQQLSTVEARLRSADLATLIRRAETQHAAIEKMRQSYAVQALAQSTPAASSSPQKIPRP